MILAGDIGGTHARLAFFDVVDGQIRLTASRVFPSREYRGLDEIVSQFVSESNLHPQTASFGVPGPVRNGRVETSNLPWIIEAKRLCEELQVEKTLLINDLEANAWGIPSLDSKDVVALNQVKGVPVGNQAVVSAGTGLGEAGMFWDGKQNHVWPCEGGHCDFAPRNELEVDLFRYLAKRFGHVSYERIVSGPGLVNVFRFLKDTGRGAEPPWLTEQMQNSDPAAAISKAAVAGQCPTCEHALDLFISVYGAEAGNVALKFMAMGGVYLGGGIAPKLVAKLAGPLFMQNFVGKGRLQPLLEAVPVRVIVNDKTALMGAARYAIANSQV
jgi:glucokinase